MSYLKMVAVYSTNKFVIIRLLSIQIEKEMTSVTERAHETGDRSSRNNCRFNEIQHFAINTRTYTPAALLETKFIQQWADGKKIKFVSRLAFICCPSFSFLINLFDSIRLIVHFFSLAANYALAHTHTHKFLKWKRGTINRNNMNCFIFRTPSPCSIEIAAFRFPSRNSLKSNMIGA